VNHWKTIGEYKETTGDTEKTIGGRKNSGEALGETVVKPCIQNHGTIW